MLHPLLVNFLIDKYASKDDVIFDPFCGSGVTLLQSSVKGYKSLGFDINPLALLIAKSKTQKYTIKKLKEEFLDLQKKVHKNKKVDVPDIKNIDYWYTKEAINDLGRIRYVLKNSDYKYKEFFLTIFAFICRNQSLTRNGEFKRYRIKEEKISSVKNEVIEKFLNHINESIKIFEKNDIPKVASKPILANSENKIDENIKYNLVITSPPYGDSRTTVAYGEYSSFGSEWTDDLHSYGTTNYRVDKESLGKVGLLNEEINKHKVLVDILKQIEEKDEKRAKDVLHFFNGYYNVIKNVVNNLEENGRVCFVVGNRNVKGYQIPMDQITASFFDGMGLSFEGIFVRDILNKVMPSQNSPSNKVGVKVTTMANEYIVVFNKKLI
jgi:DNA modification methylase